MDISPSENEIDQEKELINNGMTRYLIYDIKVNPNTTNKTRQFKNIRTMEVNIVITNLMSCIRKGHHLHYSRDNSWTKKSKYNKKGINNKNIIKAIDQLNEMGYLDNFKTSPQAIDQYRLSSWLTPTKLFIETFCDTDELLEKADISYIQNIERIILRCKKKKKTDYLDNNYTREARRVLNGINLINTSHNILDKDGVILDNLYSRIFNNGKFDQGGRFYGAGVLNIENKMSNDRLRITIDGEPICEIDYSGIHIQLLAILLDVEVDNENIIDIYLTPLPLLYRNIENRNLIKTSINTMINSTSLRDAVGSIQHNVMNVSPEGTYCFKTANDVVIAINDTFPELKEAFCNPSSTGLLLQNIESNIAHSILNVFVEAEMPCLVIHDSFIVRQRDAELLVKTMKEEFNRAMEVDGIVKMKIQKINADGTIYSADCSC